MAVRRLFGLANDSTLGGTPFDALTSGNVPAPTEFWPITNATVDYGVTTLERNDEIRGVRGNTAPRSFRSAPTVTVSGRLYPAIARKLIRLATGATDTRTGTTQITHKFSPVGFGATGLPAVHLHVVRDDIWESFSGGQISSLELNFPLDDAATFTATFVCLYRKVETGSPTVIPVVEGGTEYILRDARYQQAAFGGVLADIPNLRSFSMTFDNGMRDPDYFPRKHRVEDLSNSTRKVLWYPAQRRLGSAQEVTGSVEFVGIDSTMQDKMLMRAAQVAQFEVLGDTLAGGGFDTMRIDLHKLVLAGGGPGALTRDDDLNSSFEFGAYLDDALGKDLTVSFVDLSNVNIT